MSYRSILTKLSTDDFVIRQLFYVLNLETLQMAYKVVQI